MPASIEDQIIEVYSVAMQEYMKYIAVSDAVKQSKYSSQIVHVGWKTLSHVFNVIYIKTRDLETTYRCFQKAYLVYLEYVEQIICAMPMSKFESNGVVQFVYNKIFNELSAKTASSPANIVVTVIHDDFLNWINTFSSIVYNWQNDRLSINDRYNLGDKYLQSYLILFCKLENRDWIIIFNGILENCATFRHDVTSYSKLLTDWYHFAKPRKLPDTEKIKELYLQRFCIEREKFDELAIQENSRQLLEWIFKG